MSTYQMITQQVDLDSLQHRISMCLRTACRSTQLHLPSEAGRLPAAVWLTSYNIVSPASTFSLQRPLDRALSCPPRSTLNLPRPLAQTETCHPC